MKPKLGYNEKLTFDDVLLEPKFNNISSRADVDLSCKIGPLKLGIPILSAPMDTITNVALAKVLADAGGLPILHRANTIFEQVQMVKELGDRQIGAAVGVKDTIERTKALYEANVSAICIDVAHGHSSIVGETIATLKKEFPKITVIAGNVCTSEGAKYLRDSGADIIRVGTGGGSACTTRLKTGFGIPQLSAILGCSDLGIPIISDGGHRTPGDIAKALAAGASMVMLAGMFSGCEECGVNFRGMASEAANIDQFGDLAEWKTAEGISTVVLPKGPLKYILKDITGGLRSALTYAGANDLKTFREKTSFVRITPAGYAESKAHILS